VFRRGARLSAKPYYNPWKRLYLGFSVLAEPNLDTGSWMSAGKVLFIDAYDSFSNNIISLLEANLPVTVESIHIDDPRFVFNDDAFFDYLQHFDAVVAGPGPGHPGHAQDVGLIGRLWTLDEEHQVPVLGICLGFQSLCLAHSAEVERLQQPRHGLITNVVHCGKDLFDGTGDIWATQYHSLHAVLHDYDWTMDRLRDPWTPRSTCPDLTPLAWDMSDASNGPILMAVRHRYKPLHGVQYHPESICTNAEGHKLVVNWWREACHWNDHHRRGILRETVSLPFTPSRTPSPASLQSGHSGSSVQWISVQATNPLDTSSIAQMLKLHAPNHAPIVLESGPRNGEPVNPETGRFSIIGVHDERSLHIRYVVSSHTLIISQGVEVLLSESLAVADVFSTLEQFIADRKAADGPSETPFWGGLMGFASYEAGLETIDVCPSPSPMHRPDVWFVYIERSVVLDHVANTVHIQSLLEDDQAWLAGAESDLLPILNYDQAEPPVDTRDELSASLVSGPEHSQYCHKVEQCQAHLRAGSSYELCLTDQTHIHSSEDPWSIYSRLRTQNPAPFGAFMNLRSHTAGLTGITVLSSSPERFLSWSRSGECQFRPIKGTVKKSLGVTRQDAEAILSSPKEQAENLMIVDLIRHDLSGVRGQAPPNALSNSHHLPSFH